MVYLFLGPSGCGKDTQVDMLVKKTGAIKITTGEMFRTEFERKTTEGIEAEKAWGRGLWVDDYLTYRMFAKWVEQYDSDKDWYFIAAVRTPEQVPLFDQMLEKHNKKLSKVIHFSLSEAAAVERLSLRRVCPKCGENWHLKYKAPKDPKFCDYDGTELITRADDRPDAIRSRMLEYDRTIAPILRQYEERGILIDIDAAPSIEVIHKEVCKKLNVPCD